MGGGKRECRKDKRLAEERTKRNWERTSNPQPPVPLGTGRSKRGQGRSGCPGDLGIPRIPQAGPGIRGARPHSLDLQRAGLNLHLHLVGGTGEQLDGAVLTEALPIHLEEDRAIIGLDAQRDGEAHQAGQVPHGWALGGRGGYGGRRRTPAATQRLESGGRRGSEGREREVEEGRLPPEPLPSRRSVWAFEEQLPRLWPPLPHHPERKRAAGTAPRPRASPSPAPGAAPSVPVGSLRPTGHRQISVAGGERVNSVYAP